uniref:CSON001407 protein n=1 Tax=Culicoides sonorensis TaxID=179676 RepID=A0A336MH11_CULSO
MDLIIVEHNKKIWEENKFENVSFSFPECKCEKIIKVNKTILAEVSPVFEAMFFGELSEKTNTIPILDDPETFESLLKCIYTSTVPVKSFDEIVKLFVIANKYEVIPIEKYCIQFLIMNLKDFDLDSLISFGEMFFLNDFVQLCKIYKNHQPNLSIAPHWVLWKKGDPLPPGTFFADCDKDGWPLGVGRAPNNAKVGTLSIREMKVTMGSWATAWRLDDNFEILCDGNLSWIEVSHFENMHFFPHVNNEPSRLFIGKLRQENEVYIGSMEKHSNILEVGNDRGSFRPYQNFYELLDMNLLTQPNMAQYVFNENLCQIEIKLNLIDVIQEKRSLFLGQQKYNDFKFTFPMCDKFLEVNRVILAQVLPMFYLLDTSNGMEISEVDFVTFEKFIKYIYTNKLTASSLVEAKNLIEIGSKYELYCIKDDYEQFLQKNLRDFAVSEVHDFASKLDMFQLLKLCDIIMSNHPSTNERHSWVKWKKGQPLPSSTFFADYDETGWPIAIARFDTGRIVPGPLDIKTMTATNGVFAVSSTNDEEFEILCGGNLKWKHKDEMRPYHCRIRAGISTIGKTIIDGKVYIGKIELPYFFIPYKSGEACIAYDWELIDDTNT